MGKAVGGKSPPADLRNARILVTNDDGIHAPGLKVLEKIARSLSDDVWVVTPESEHSGASHALTLRRPLQIHRLGPRRFAIAGTPTDCVLVAVNHLVVGKRPDLVLSGVNRGANLGEDVLYSGTVAAAMEASMLGIPAIAMSQVRAGETLHWATALKFGADIVKKLVALEWPDDLLMNVNFPPIPPEKVTGIVVGAQGRRKSEVQVVKGKDPFARDVLWVGDFSNDEPEDPHSDLAVISRNAIAITPLHFDLTQGAMLKRMAGLFPGARAAAQSRPATRPRRAKKARERKA
ncbi:MAG TPA: 5'/3'-nucleotidase SurE [Dongiaceae bacterium]|nr:5'/3'-nucleotidase SurE [Dongiaceae bacterium]